MRLIFVALAVALAAAGAALYWTAPDTRSEVPVIYWVIDPAPARQEQIALFHQWLIRNGHGRVYTLSSMSELRQFRGRAWSPAVRQAIGAANADGAAVWDAATDSADLPLTVRAPLVEMRLDAASNDLSKKLVQGVSGVAGDVIEAYSGGRQMQYLAAAGMLADVTDSAREHGFGPERTYPALAPSLYYGGRQYAFPRNVAQAMYWINEEAFARAGLPVPPRRWTVAEFERIGKQYLAAVNPPGERPQRFFADRALKDELRRSLGLSLFNETLTRCMLDDPRNAQVLGLIRKWTYEDHLLPTAADLASFDTEGGWGGQSFQLFRSGRYALLASGRWALMLFRRFGAMELAVAEPPHLGMPNTILSGGQSTVYRASRHAGAAELFLAYMASEDYNTQIVRDGDALPPNPQYATTELFRRPPEHPNEWGCHEAFYEAATEIAIAQSFSPFVLPVTVERFDTMAEQEVMNARATPEQAAARAAARVNEQIQRNLSQSAALRRRYEELCARQQEIQARRRAGQPVPSEWILNPFHRVWYGRSGWLAETGSDT